ncbi:MAG: recombinase family protein [Pirellulales bacterium]
MKRHGFARILQLLRDGVANGLLILKIDRLCRDVADGQHLLREYFGIDSKYGKHLFSVNDYVDTRTANGLLLFNLQLVIAAWERQTISERTKAALTFKRKNGERCGGLLYGFDLAADGTTLVPNKQE